MTNATIDRASVCADTHADSALAAHHPSRAGIPVGISAEQLEAAKRVLEAEINKARSGAPSAGSDTRP